jgi:integrase
MLAMPPGDVTEAHLLYWFGTQNWKRETRRSYRSAARGFFAWAHGAGHISANPAVKLKPITMDRPAPKPAPDPVWVTAVEVADARTLLMLKLAAEVGLRRGEVAQVHTRDLQQVGDGPALLIHGKGAKERIVPVSGGLATLIALGAAGHTPGASDSGWLFPGNTSGHLSPMWVGELCARVMPGVWTMHSLRHRFASRAYRGTRNLRAVQTLMGHSNVSVTERYVAVDDTECRAAMHAARYEPPTPREPAPSHRRAASAAWRDTLADLA